MTPEEIAAKKAQLQQQLDALLAAQAQDGAPVATSAESAEDDEFEFISKSQLSSQGSIVNVSGPSTHAETSIVAGLTPLKTFDNEQQALQESLINLTIEPTARTGNNVPSFANQHGQAPYPASGSAAAAEHSLEQRLQAIKERNAALRMDLAQLEAADASSTQSGGTEVNAVVGELERAKAEAAALQAAMESGEGLSRLVGYPFSDHDADAEGKGKGPAGAPDAAAALEACKKRQARLEARLAEETSRHGNMSSLRRSVMEGRVKLDGQQRGIDICFLMDCTGSMDPYIDEMLRQVQNIIAEVESMHKQAVIRMAFVGYRDFEDKPQFEVQDFLSCDDVDAMLAFLRGVSAKGGDDACEDIAGGIRQTLNLAWMASTKLLIHFGDAPCHGREYHDIYKSDSYPDGNPDGLKPEDTLTQLCSNRVDYYFVRITPAPDKMAAIFKQVYALSHNAHFKIIDARGQARDFVPVVINSVSYSMDRSFLNSSSDNSSRSSSRGGASLPRIYASLLR